jgi:hypothetical protein
MTRELRIRPRLLAVFMTVTAAGGLALTAQQALAATLCVGSGHDCYPTIQAAIDAAQDGDTITVGPGTFAGGVTIPMSVRLQGAGPASTIIRGGGPVLTIGTFGAPAEPTVSVSGVTITGGVTRSSPESAAITGEDGVIAAGGGVYIPPDTSLLSGVGATVTISDSVITGNHADPSATVPSGVPCPGFPGDQCPFGEAIGGGIDSWGALTLVNSTVSRNTVGAAAGLPPLPSETAGAGITSDRGSLTLAGVTMTGNQAVAAAPNGAMAEGGDIYVGFFSSGGQVLTVKNSAISGNTASVTSDLPSSYGGQVIDEQANDAGIHVDDGNAISIENSAITGNLATASNLNGEAESVDAAMSTGDSALAISDTVISGNTSLSKSGTTTDVGPGGDAIEVDGGGTITNTAITGNVSAIASPGGAATVVGALGVYNFTNDPKLLTVRGSTISGNTLSAATTTGQATVQGAGIFNNSLLELIGDTVSNNSGTASGPAGTAAGGGIWNGVDLSGPPVQLTLVRTAVTRNALSAGPGITVQGGGLFTTLPVTLMSSVIAGNVPDQCSGCTSSADPAGPQARENNQPGRVRSLRDHQFALP